MRKSLIPVIVAALIATPAQAKDPVIDLGPGAFVGARIKLPLGGKTVSKPQAGFAIAPTRSSVSSDGMVRTRIGEGLTLDLTSHAKPVLTLSGVRADTALGLQPQGQLDAQGKLGVSTGGWIAIGVGAVALVGALIYVGKIVECERDPDDNCGSD